MLRGEPPSPLLTTEGNTATARHTWGGLGPLGLRLKAHSEGFTVLVEAPAAALTPSVVRSWAIICVGGERVAMV